MWRQASAALALLALGACNTRPERGAAGLASAAPSATADPCPGRRSADPPASALGPAQAALEAKRYAEAQQRLTDLGRRYPYSATVRRLLGEAFLYEHQSTSQRADYEAAADRSLAWFQPAAELDARGCQLSDADAYYLLLDTAYAHLRKRQGEAALGPLAIARQRWPSSAEVPYHLARANCLLGKLRECGDDFATTLELARTLSRPKFLRTYHSVDDWIRRSLTQSELGPLRKSLRYAELVKAARAAR
jgi:hypothetical protein